ncbi:MAG: RNA methyltransferase tRNA(m5U54)methyltransferase [Piccolia ochrophora]|nr:MAG: RNA methyltransferase tRNA(m5U54)methyltransferase [Piccolia ochrophora]
MATTDNSSAAAAPDLSSPVDGMNQRGDAPSEDHAIIHGGHRYNTVREGLASILVPEKDESSATKKAASEEGNNPQSVFYNPIQQFNRDLTVLAIHAFGQEHVAAKTERQRNAGKGGVKTGKKRKRGAANGETVDLEPLEGEKRRRGEDDQVPGGMGSGTDGEAQQKHGHDAADTETQSITEPKEPTVSVEAQEDPLPEGSNPISDPAEQIPSQPFPESKPPLSSTPEFRILDALSATGLRALRYAQEIPYTTSVVANDFSKAAIASIKLNVQHNHQENKIQVRQGDAKAHMYSVLHVPRLKYDVVDLDPYGTAAPFLDAAVQSVVTGGLLCVTCTDAAVFASTGYPEKTYALYGGAPLKGPHGHEAGLRLILHAIASSAARYGLAMEPLLSLSIDFYARVFVRIRYSPLETKLLAGKTMLVYSCDQGCGAWTTQPLGKNKESQNKTGGMFYKHGLEQGPSAAQNCEHCGFKTHIAGPMYAGPIHSPAFIRRILALLPTSSPTTYTTLPRIEGMLSTALDEDLSQLPSPPSHPPSTTTTTNPSPPLTDPTPFFLDPSSLSRVLHCTTPPEPALRSAIHSLGHRASRSHAKPGSVKTDAPWRVVWAVMRAWVRQKAPVKEASLKQGSAGWRILYGVDDGQDASDGGGDAGKVSSVDFDNPPRTHGRGGERRRIVRYQRNPRPNWGPMNRAKGGDGAGKKEGGGEGGGKDGGGEEGVGK